MSETPDAVSTCVTVRTKTVSKLIDRLQEKILEGADCLSLGQKARWALRDEDEMDGLMEKPDRLITNLERLFPGLQEQRNQIATDDAAAVVAPIDSEGCSEALAALKAAAARRDQNFNVAAGSTSSVYC
ncbi:hypothetical protein LTR82_017626 [Friedmanniomyces endolithicus]|uniref:Prion-inhibition and propagation HeLo domain-containing protein n=1 Tax=Friedmanniomyces endolithicus TaxID=329885 RepID=A0AAN6J034_9PEZI|nr:hypothetical protein LTR82_017626 [Friedmanniomyces endolithicus]